MKHKKKKKDFLIIFIFGIILLMSVFSFQIFKEKQTDNSYYLIFAQNKNEKDNIIKLCVDIKTKQGAGFLWNNNGNNYVITSLYLVEDDANSVLSKLKDKNNDKEKIDYGILKIKSNDKKNNLNIYKETINFLYELNLKYDKKELTYYETCNYIRTFLDNKKNEVINLINKEKDLIKKEYLKIYIKTTKENLQQLIFNERIENFSSSLKYEIVNVLKNYINLISELNNKKR